MMDDYISPDEIEAHRQRAIDRRYAIIAWVIMLIIALVMLALFVPM